MNAHTHSSVEQFFTAFADAWETNEGEAVAALFVDDGALINPFGQRADGRTAIVGMYSDYFAGMLKGTSTTFSSANVRTVEPEHALVDGEQTISASNGEVILVVHMTALLRRDANGWRFVDARPYTFLAVPA